MANIPIQSAFPRRWRWARWSTGLANSQYLKNVYSSSFGYTSTKKKIAAGTATAILASTPSTITPQTIINGITQPDVPRALSVTVGGTAAQVLDSAIVITGLNVEGKVITETFKTTAGATGAINGAKAFMTVTSIFWPAQLGTGVTITVGTQNKLGVFHRLIPNNTTVKVITASTLVGTSTNAVPALPIFDGVPTVVADASIIENNLVTPLTTPDGTKFMYICYQYDNWLIGAINDGTSRAGFLYHTTTSTSSTSTSTTTSSLTTSTSTSSTSTSSTSSSTSSTSSSTSSTSTSTTTTP